MGSKRMGVVKDGVIQDDWPTIIKICQAGKAKNYYTVGDHKSITVNGIAFDMDYLGQGLDVRADGKDNSNLTTWLARTTPWSCQWNTSSVTTGSWIQSDIRKYCRETIYAGLPEEIRNAVIEVTKSTNDYYKYPPVTDTVWIPTYDEIFGGGLYKERFPNDASRQKTGTDSRWWLRYAYDRNFASYVYSDGSHSTAYASHSFGIVPGFCI